MSFFKQEDLDFESLLNLDGTYSSPSTSSASLKGKSIAAPEFRPAIINQNTFAPLQHSSQTFSGPSHQYDLHKQHIPLPPGALANTLAATQRNNISYNGYSQELGIGSNTGMYELNEELFDFNAVPAHNPSFSGSNDMDMDFDSPVEGSFSNDGEFVDPHAIGGQEEDSPTPTRAEIVRVYPGMHAHHAQQAALAKQQQQMEIQRQQQQRTAQRSQNPGHKSTPSRSSGNRTPMDPAVEERISRLLSQMRQNNGSPNDALGQKQSPQPNSSKPKKDEEDMDEDERLLASEEGKKLSSKERRQLRNKVSARAFRSRRKEYIGQLEGEVAAKASETDSLRAENEALRAENSRLTDLTKLLLSSSAFSTFLNDLSTNGLPASIVSGPTQASTAHQQTQPQHDANSNQQQYQMQQRGNVQPGMAMIPEQNVDFSSLDSGANWNTGLDFNFAPHVFAVTEIPEGPAVDSIDTNVLSGKSKPAYEYNSEKIEKPIIEALPELEKNPRQFVCDETVEFDDSDPAFALFDNAASCPVTPEPVYQIFGPISIEKAVARYDLVVEEESSSADGIVSASTMAKFENICSSLDALAARLEGMMART